VRWISFSQARIAKISDLFSRILCLGICFICLRLWVHLLKCFDFACFLWKTCAMCRLNYGRARTFFTIILTDYCASYMTYLAVVPKFATISQWAPPVLSNINFASKLNPLLYFAIGSLLYVMEKWTSFHVNVFCFCCM